MNYVFHYERLIARARYRTLVVYKERHHVVPRCMGGGNEPENLVDLTAEEHYVAHQLLVKMYPHVAGLITATIRMSRQCTGNKSFGWLRRRHAAVASIAMRGNTHGKGVVFSAEHRAKLSAAQIGRRKSTESIAKTAAGHRGKKLSDEAKARIGDASRLRTHTQETRRKISTSLVGRKMSLEAIEKAAASHRGKKRSAETRAKLVAAWCIRRAKQQITPIPNVLVGAR